MLAEGVVAYSEACWQRYGHFECTYIAAHLDLGHPDHHDSLNADLNPPGCSFVASDLGALGTLLGAVRHRVRSQRGGPSSAREVSHVP